MQPLLRTLRTLALLAVALASLVGAAVLLDEWPPKSAVTERRLLAEAQARAEAERRARAAREADAARRAAAAQAVRPPTEVARFEACDGAAEAHIGRLRLGQSIRPLLSLACGGSVRALGFVDAHALVVAQVTPAAVEGAPPVRSFVVASDDVTGDGAIDWLVGTVRATDATAPRSGSLHLLRGDGRGAFAEPELLAPVAAERIHTGTLDADAVPDVVVIHRPDAVGTRASEAWLFAGGPTVTRRDKLTLAREVEATALLDADADTHLDLVLAGRAAIPSAFGDGAFGFTRTADLELPVARALVGMRGPRLGAAVLVAGDHPRLLSGAAPNGAVLEVRLPPGPVAADALDDGTRRIVLWIAAGRVLVVSLDGATPTTLSDRALRAADGRVVDGVLGDFAGDAGLEVALLVERAGATPERDLVVLPAPSTDGELSLAARRDPLVEAPLHLDVVLR